MDYIYAASCRAGLRAYGAALECQNAPTLPKGGDVVQPPFLDRFLCEGANQGNAVDVKFDADCSLLNARGLRHFTRVDMPCIIQLWKKRLNIGNILIYK